MWTGVYLPPYESTTVRSADVITYKDDLVQRYDDIFLVFSKDSPLRFRSTRIWKTRKVVSTVLRQLLLTLFGINSVVFAHIPECIVLASNVCYLCELLTL